MVAQDRDFEGVYGDFPANINLMPGSIRIDDVANPNGLAEKARGHLKASPHILEDAKRLGKDLVAYSSSHGKEIIIGVGVASVITAATASGIIIYKHRHRK